MRWVLIGGQMKAATTSLHSMLCRHPDVRGTHPKETSWWTSRVDAAAFLNRFAHGAGDRVILDGSVNATRAITPLQRVLASFETLPPPEAVIYMVREERPRIASQALHTFYHDRFIRSRRAAAVCVDEALRSSDIAARFEPWLDACPDTRFIVAHFEAFAQDPVGVTQAIAEALELAPWEPHERHENDKGGQQPLRGPLRILPGRDRMIRLAKRVLGSRTRFLRRLLGGRAGVPSSHPYIDDEMARRSADIEAIAAANRDTLARMEPRIIHIASPPSVTRT